MPEYFSNDISQAILYTIMYSDVFDYPLTAGEVHRFLHEKTSTYEHVLRALNEDSRITRRENYYFLTGRDAILNIRKEREMLSHALMPYAVKYGRILGHLPFVRMVALTGSLAVMNVSRNADFDYMLVTSSGRLWTARAFVLLFGRLTRLLGHTICPNLIVSLNSLRWYRQDLYSARELCQMIPITGQDVYQKLMQENEWVQALLPNAVMESGGSLPNTQYSILQKSPEFILSGKLGDRFENWEMNRKISRFSKQEGFGEETIFNAELCQGNFDHHRQWTQTELQQRLQATGTAVEIT